ncbi:MAG: MobF family relaxase [Pseudomonadota bacterium]
MITLSPVSASGAAEYYAADNQTTLEDGMNLSEWQGGGATKLGLSGQVDVAVFERVLQGKLPDGSELTATRGEHRPGLDLTFSAPKSVSLVALLGKDERVVEAFRASVAASLRWAQANLAQARVWKEGQQIPEDTGNLLAATFLHDVNRNNEPMLHVHAIVANATLASDGKWHALKNDGLFTWQHTLGAVHNAELRSRLEDLGYETVPARNPIDGSFEIKGVTREAVEAFSTRTGEIEAALEQEGRSSPRERELATLATRKAKQHELTPERRMVEWEKRAASVGLNLQPIVQAARNSVDLGETVWTRVMDGIRGIGNKGLALAAAMGLTAKDRDELVPERKGGLGPKEFAAAQAVASAVRELTEYEAGFDRLDLLRIALERRGPLTAAAIEDRFASLQARGLLIGDTRMMTTPSMLKAEKKAVREVEAGKGASPILLAKEEAAKQLQQEARALGLRRLNPGQQGVGVDILSSRDRVHIVQGGAGVGKSAALIPLAAIARSEGRTVHAFAIAARTAREFGGKVGTQGKTISSLLSRYRRILDGKATDIQIEAARKEIGGSYIMVDEASLIGTEQFEKLVRLANILKADRLVLAGDKGQLQAIAAGKPFEQAQDRGAATSHVTENLRAESKQMKAVVAALEAKDVAGAFEALKDKTIEVARDEGAHLAAKLWITKEPQQREETLLLTAGRAMRSSVNEMVQRELLAKGELGANRIELTVLDRVTISREGARQMRAYREGRIVEFMSNLRVQGIDRGERGRVVGLGDGHVILRMNDGRRQKFEPHRLAKNLAHDAVSVFEEKMLGLHEGDCIRWTQNDTDKVRALFNGDIARIEKIGENGVSVSTKDSEVLDLKNNDPMLEKLDLAYAVNAHVAQGMTSKGGILVLSERETKLNTTRSFLVAATRISGEATLVVDNATRVERSVTRNAGDKTSALEVAQNREPAANQRDKAKEHAIDEDRHRLYERSR